jgi:steroid delta-isomerase-like uncharacterized protein
MTPEAVVRQWFEQVWTQKREDAIERLLAPDALIHDLPTPDGQPIQGAAAFKPFHARFVAAFPDLRIEVERTVTEGDMVAAYCRVTATHRGEGLGIAASGRNVTITGIVMARIANGQIAEGWNSFDFLSLYQQLGIVPTLA